MIISVLLDKNRNAGYNFTNGQFVLGKKLWYPLEGTPDDNWNCHEEPVPSRPHDAIQLKLSGSMAGLKNKTAVTITITGAGKEFIEKYRDLKAILFPGRPGNEPSMLRPNINIIFQKVFLSNPNLN